MFSRVFYNSKFGRNRVNEGKVDKIKENSKKSYQKSKDKGCSEIKKSCVNTGRDCVNSMLRLRSTSEQLGLSLPVMLIELKMRT